MNTTKLIGSAVILLCGMITHITGLNLFYLEHNNLHRIAPTYATGLFVFSVLCILLKWRPEWPNVSNKAQKFFLFMLEIGVVLYVTDVITRQVWIPALDVLRCVCNLLGEYTFVWNKHALEHIAPVLAAFILHEGFCIGSFGVAMIAFKIMLHFTGVYGYIRSKLRRRVVNIPTVEPVEPVEPVEQVAFCERCRSQTIGGFRPQVDLLNLTRRGRGPPRRTENNGN